MLSRASASLRSVRAIPRITPRLARGYAAEADVKLPLELYGLEGTYASALYTAAAKDKALPQTASAVGKLRDLLASDKKARIILTDPSLSSEDKKTVISTITESVGGDKVFKGFLETLAENNRMSLIDEVVENYFKLQNAGEGLVEATVTSVSPLDPSTLKKINTAIANSKYVGKDKKLQLSNIVDESIKGGLVVSLGDRTVDLSVANKLSRYNQLLNESI